jgi:hypothetical protein
MYTEIVPSNYFAILAQHNNTVHKFSFSADGLNPNFTAG